MWRTKARKPRVEVTADGFVTCPHCGAGVFYPCITPGGRIVLPPHRARVAKAKRKGY